MSSRALVLVALLGVVPGSLPGAPWQPLDDAARTAVQHARRPWLEAPMHALTDGGRPLLVAGAIAALAAGTVGRTGLVESAVVLAPVNLVVEGLKWATYRARPDGSHRRSNAAFPSSHAANAFALAVVLGRRWRRAAAPLAILATLVAYSRMYLDRHWLTDVGAGAAIGALGAWLALWAWAALRARGSAPEVVPAD